MSDNDTLSRQARALYRRRAENLDADTRGRLRQHREAALQRAPQRWTWGLGPALAMAGLCAFLLMRPATDVEMAQPITALDAPIEFAEEPAVLLERELDPDFFLWMADDSMAMQDSAEREGLL